MVESLDKVLQTLDSENQEAKKFEISIPAKRLQRSELSLDINDILALDLEAVSLEPKHPEKSVQPKKIKCCPTLIGSADFSEDRRHLVSHRACSALHCRNCDFSVSCFSNYEWIEDVEYFFLRTYMPNFQKVSEKLKAKNGSVAYACHCVSFSTNKLQHLQEEDLPWFCRGHVA